MRRDWLYPVKRLILSDRAGRWCRLPYPDHPKGCPNYGKTEKCPPKAPAAGDYFDLSRPTWLVHSEFNLASHIARMEKKHPEWTLKQCRCVLYWQPASRRQLKYRIEEALSIVNADGSTLIPEAMGVNVYATARLSGLHLERIRHLEMCRHVALIGSIKGGHLQMAIPF
ncbi:hypothetical protein [uncultured Desulfosarcina sp.]|uniref:hypothetical protein n=1 Tax=uncultured Desulfosarcina sp. TaxID=218289 RepID=UPI0029C71D45|nr:hypothetical protein [uncultured Desulfosarcina sp.]